eukprot:TRINITY_DN927_c0_g1_i5.p2 TRINITY_DN927_c0_g1~~TRINITY_DN927_c0_g1_i5.p2  ORF type:complete len:106 (+),score=20.80 TRINITY_DN927_c0_g1_i5:252-569(+)
MRALIWLACVAAASAQTFDTSKVAAIQKEFDQAGYAAKGKKVSASTIFRMGGMTKIMGGMLAAIAFEEGVVRPSDPISKYIPELGLVACEQRQGRAARHREREDR